LRRVAGGALLLVALFLVARLHLRTMLLAWQDPVRLTEYASSPTPFWMVKLMDLGIVVPAAVATGIGLWRGADRARRPAYVLLPACTGLGVCVTSMALMMIAKGDPDASVGLAAGFGVFTAVFAVLVVLIYRPLFGAAPENGTKVLPEGVGRP
jgi:hypothetical protein